MSPDAEIAPSAGGLFAENLLLEREFARELILVSDDEFLHGELLADKPLENTYEVFETDHLIKLQPWGGYTRHNRIWQRSTSLIDGGIETSLVTENHAIMMYEPLLTA